ncbi:MAG TPA: DNA-binding protein [Candidatus Nitrosotenuis sp.]|jgi:DNA-binding TFAR19-related protein (PDSD5 family)|nr:DNA-binding protein [Candidatus Nitrosotenuis sp.]
MSEDKELEALKAKRLAEMKKNIFSQKQKEQLKTDDKPVSYRDVVVSRLGYRGMEVLQNAENQFPNEAKLVIEKLGQLIHSGEINEEIDGGKLLALFRAVGINVRMATKINIEQDGKFISLSEKLSKADSDENESI